MAKLKAILRCLSGSDDGCVGMHVALQSNFISMARCVPGSMIPLLTLLHTFLLPIVTCVHCRIFWAFGIFHAAEGSNIDPTKTVNPGTTREPAPFQLRVRTRHPEVERIIESESADADLRLKEWEY